MNHINPKAKYKRWYTVSPKNKKYRSRRIFASGASGAFQRYLSMAEEGASTKRIDYIIS